jgi:hypothetical protein
VRFSATEAGHDGSADGRSEPPVLSVQPRSAHAGAPSPAPHQSDGDALAGLREKLEAFYSEIGRPSIDPELMIRMVIVGYCYGIRSERRLCEEVELHLVGRFHGSNHMPSKGKRARRAAKILVRRNSGMAFDLIGFMESVV